MRNSSDTPTRLPLLSQTAEHALRAVLYLARNGGGRFAAATEVAGALGAPPNYLAKTLRVLARQGLLDSVRGVGGGFRLHVPADRLTAADVVAAVDEVRTSRTCLLGDRSCDAARPCEVHARWTDLMQRAVRPMAETTIASLLGADGSPEVPTTSPEHQPRQVTT